MVSDGREEFKIHGGFFVVFCHMRSYVDEKISLFDHVESNTWSQLWFDDF
jgi:hypothetical protein